MTRARAHARAVPSGVAGRGWACVGLWARPLATVLCTRATAVTCQPCAARAAASLHAATVASHEAHGLQPLRGGAAGAAGRGPAGALGRGDFEAARGAVEST